MATHHSSIHFLLYPSSVVPSSTVSLSISSQPWFHATFLAFLDEPAPFLFIPTQRLHSHFSLLHSQPSVSSSARCLRQFPAVSQSQLDHQFLVTSASTSINLPRMTNTTHESFKAMDVHSASSRNSNSSNYSVCIECYLACLLGMLRTNICTGFNCEGVNLAIGDWFPLGAVASHHHALLNRMPLLPYEELLRKEAMLLHSSLELEDSDYSLGDLISNNSI